MRPYLAVNFLDIVVDAEFMTFRICSDSSMGVTTHRDLMWLDETDLSVLIEHSEGISLRLEDDADSLKAGCQIISMHSCGQCQSHALKLD